MRKFKLLLPIGVLLIALFSNPAYSQYCYSDTILVSGELSGETIVEDRILKAENATVSADGALIGAGAVILAPNFHVPAGVNFTASVIDCRGTKPYLTAPKENAVLDNGCEGSNNTDMLEWYFEWNEVAGATQYQLLVTIPGAPHPAINRTTTNTHYTHLRNTSFIGNAVTDNWEASVRALVDDVWTPWYGGAGDLPLKFSVEPVNTDCPPLITAPLPQATLDNGCNGVNETMTWDFEWTEIEGATEYQLIVRHPSVSVNTVNEIVTTNSWTLSRFTQINTYFTDWTVKVRAKVDGLWGDYHGSTLAEEVMLFNVERTDTDCAPIITNPSPSAVLENGCIYPLGFYDWEFEATVKPIATETEILVKRPDGSTYSSDQLIEVTSDTTYEAIYRHFTSFIPADELSDWSVQARSKINGAWTRWYGHSLFNDFTSFEVAAPSTDCAPLITTPTPNTILDNGCTGINNPDDWYFEWNAVENASEYTFVISNPIETIYVLGLTTNNYTISNTTIPVNELNGWSVKVSALVFGVWTDYYGSDINQAFPLNIEPPDTDCPNLINNEATSRNQSVSPFLEKSIDFTIYPNPIRQEGTIEYTLAESAEVQMEIYTLTGQLVQSVVPKTLQSTGNYSVNFKVGTNLANGLYLFRLQVGEAIQFKKIVLNY